MDVVLFLCDILYILFYRLLMSCVCLYIHVCICICHDMYMTLITFPYFSLNAPFGIIFQFSRKNTEFTEL